MRSGCIYNLPRLKIPYNFKDKARLGGREVKMHIFLSSTRLSSDGYMYTDITSKKTQILFHFLPSLSVIVTAVLHMVQTCAV